MVCRTAILGPNASSLAGEARDYLHMTTLVLAEPEFATELWRTLTLQVPHNTAVVMRGATVLGLACGVVGAFLLLRKRSLVADAISHAALPGVCVGFIIVALAGGTARSLLVL